MYVKKPLYRVLKSRVTKKNLSFFKSLRPLSPSTKMSAEAYMYIQRALIH